MTIGFSLPQMPPLDVIFNYTFGDYGRRNWDGSHVTPGTENGRHVVDVFIGSDGAIRFELPVGLFPDDNE